MQGTQLRTYRSTTDILTTSINAGVLPGFCIFNPPGSGRPILITSVLIGGSNSSGTLVRIKKHTADAAFTNIITPQSSIIGDTTPSIALVDSSPNAVSVSAPVFGTTLFVVNLLSNAVSELLTNSETIELLPGFSILVYLNVFTAGNTWVVSTVHKE